MTDEAKVALVTGSALNIGRAIALALASDGFRIMTTARQSEADARETARLVREAGSDADTHLADISDHRQATALVEATVKRFAIMPLIVDMARVRWPRGSNRLAWPPDPALPVFGASRDSWGGFSLQRHGSGAAIA